VKRSEQEELARKLNHVKEQSFSESFQTNPQNDRTDAFSGNGNIDDQNVQGNNDESSVCIDDITNEEMSDADDKRESLDPTEDQPYRRLRRYTIT
jgi:hypothetical protein